MRVFAGLAELAEAEGENLGVTDWLEIDQARIDQFAAATGDHQWIHVDSARAADGPFGSTIAHGLLTLSLLPVFFAELYRVDGVAMAINYGFDRVRFISPVPVGAKLRAAARIVSVEAGSSTVQAMVETTFEIAGYKRPAAVVASIVRYIA